MIVNDVKEIAKLKKKMKNDPVNAAIYEREVWRLYTHVT